MWIVFRLSIACLVGLYKFFKRCTGVQGRNRSRRIEWVYRQPTSKGRILSTSFGLPLALPIFLRLSPENSADRFFKSVGFAREFQTGAESFDRKVYIACDHPAIETVLQADEGARAAILALFDRAAKRIYSDGAHLWVYRKGDAMPDEHEVALLERARVALAAVSVADLRLLKDPFFLKALLVESVAWALAIYGVAALFEFGLRAEPLYFDVTSIVRIGLLTAVVLFAGLAALAWWLLRGTSRAHRVLLESLLALCVGVPLSSLVVASDLNTGLDRSPPTVVSAVVQSKHITVTRSRKSGTRNHFHVRLAALEPTTPFVRTQFEVSSTSYGAAPEGGRLAIVMRRGALGVPWLQEIRPAK